jgi:hypothetical protein
LGGQPVTETPMTGQPIVVIMMMTKLKLRSRQY